MNRKLMIFLVIYGLILAGFAGLRGEILALAIPFIMYLVVGFWDSPSDPELTIKREIESVRVLPRTPVTVKLTIENKGRKIELIIIEDTKLEGLEIIQGSARKVCRLAAGEMTELIYTISGTRGIYRFDHVDVRILGKSGLFELKKTYNTTGQIFILPDVPQLKRLAFRSLQTMVYSGNNPARLAGSGTDFFSVRHYQPGDPLRYINWRLSARFPELIYSNEFERERVSDVWLVLDGRHRSNLGKENIGLFEHMILAGAGLTRALLNEGNRVGLLIYGGYMQWTYPGYGKVQRERMFRSLAQAQPGNLFIFSKLDNLPTRMFPLSAHLIFISPLHPEDIPILFNLRARGYPILVISPDPVMFETGVLAKEEGGESGLRIATVERRLMLKRLNNAGIQVINWNVALPFELAVQSRLKHAMWRFHPQRQLK